MIFRKKLNILEKIRKNPELFGEVNIFRLEIYLLSKNKDSLK